MAFIMIRLLVLLFSLCLSSVSSLTLAQGKKILVLGDSLSAAYQIPKDQGWVNLLRQRVKPRWEVINGAVSGATTAHGLNLLPGLLTKHRPDIVLLELGGNDGLQGKPVTYVSKNLDKLILISKDHGAKVILLGIRIPPNLGERYTKPFFEQYRDLSKRHNLSYLPFLLEGVATNPSLMKSDGIHPTASAQPKILANVWPVLAPHL